MRDHSFGSSSMLLDLPTLFAATVFANALAGVLLLLSWTQYRNIPSLALWGIGFVVGSIGTALLGARGHTSDFISIVLANALLALAYGIMWGGVRGFVGRNIQWPVVLLGAVLWIVASQFDVFYETPVARIFLMALIVGSYLLMSAWEFWRSRVHKSFSRCRSSSYCSSMPLLSLRASRWRPPGSTGRRPPSCGSTGSPRS